MAGGWAMYDRQEYVDGIGCLGSTMNTLPILVSEVVRAV